MPNRKAHQEAGAKAGALIALVGNLVEQAKRKNINPQYCFNVGELAAMGMLGYMGGAVGGILPDLLEPAVHPGHRNVCHSLTAGGLLVAGANKVHSNPTLHPCLKTVASAVTAGYASHLILDGQTPNGIPIFLR
jgi:membrane-bound metal-dependent hydrolase YbcI (DUF457 family)